MVQALESVFAQTFTDYEVIVVNDGSPDDTAEVLRPYIESGRIRYIEQGNQGQAAARNRGLAEATGELIAFLDDDDLWPPGRLEWQVAALGECSSVLAVAGVAEFIDDCGRCLSRGRFVPRLHYERLFEGNPLMSPGQVLIRRTVVQAIGGFDERVWGADDFQLWFELARRGPFRMQDRIALYYRLHAGNASRQARRMCEETRTVIELQASSISKRRRQNRRAGYRMLYNGWGLRFMSSFRHNMKHGEFGAAWSDLSGVSGLLVGVSSEPRLVGWFIRDLLPARIRRKVQAIICFVRKVSADQQSALRDRARGSFIRRTENLGIHAHRIH